MNAMLHVKLLELKVKSIAITHYIKPDDTPIAN